MMFRLGSHLKTAGDLANREAAVVFFVISRELLERSHDAFPGLLDGGADLVEAQRLIGDVDDRFEDRFELGFRSGERFRRRFLGKEIFRRERLLQQGFRLQGQIFF